MKDQAELVNQWLNQCSSSLKGDVQALLALLRTARSDQVLFCALFDLIGEDCAATVRWEFSFVKF